jgi:pantoate--beta-alanine ligase
MLETMSDVATLPSGSVFIPTMGALHEGHAALIRQGAKVAAGGPVVVSIFVNPTQFNDPGDFARYPKTIQSDLGVCSDAGATHVFVPAVGLMYPRGMDEAKEEAARIDLPRVATLPGLEDAKRPGHFAGVYQVVWRLFELIRPGVGIFGEKDWQQLQVIIAMTERLNAERGMSTRILPWPTIREADGLAMSSRNRFLTADERRIAPVIHHAMLEARDCRSVEAAEGHLLRRLSGAGLNVEYGVVRDAHTLRGLETGQGRELGRVLVAARLGSVRLIDNLSWA